MKKLMVIAAITVLFSTMASANSGLADRINEARTYPNKMVEDKKMENCMEHMKKNDNMSQARPQSNERHESGMNHKHS
ncbi:conserved exported hypothetical protein [Marinobacter salarius]|uniref:hypothetical protein n=1 Tax=Marinobacter salarius TaxID=1420917 RepID=UPI001259261F|nr:hypothetical protein [Marinobacter salarius]VVT32641.1 conserved exported hypothetical protein [Marinobacter salarius]VXA93809.1 conserved exported hypothetical protein [Marinobacter salarius]